jgi:hypothetical protein
MPPAPADVAAGLSGFQRGIRRPCGQVASVTGTAERPVPGRLSPAPNWLIWACYRYWHPSAERRKYSAI